MFILLEKHKTIVENLQIENNKLTEENNKLSRENNKFSEEKDDEFEKRLYEELADHISWYKKLEEELLNSSIVDKHVKESKNIVKSFIFHYGYVKGRKQDLGQEINEIRQKTLHRENLFDKYILSLRVGDYNSESFYQMNYSTDIEKHKTFYITFLEQIDKLKTEIEALKQELATQVANNITLVNELEKLKAVKS
jgi:regulator of replication initiation timing